MKESIASLAKKHGIIPKKSLGQNFIYDMSLCRKISDSASISSDDYILEIGPGTAGLTRAIAENNPKKLILIEKDERCLSLLREVSDQYAHIEIAERDALEISVQEIKVLFQIPRNKKIKIIANLPYNIASKLITNWLSESYNIESMTLMVQKEVALRISSPVGVKSYGRLSVFCQITADVKILFDVAPECFYPRPKVTSSIIRITPKENVPSKETLETLSQITQSAFSMRRKKIKTSLSDYLSKSNLDDDALDLRAENLSPEDYLNYARLILTINSPT
ncbi:MAG: 16S rRNA (adenine(1518)-N(6)/adenine(1519)-N(6))-dimethyltransferase RsmA [Rickettsiaceae bacterium]|nr:16S rRNA (adenine(1518)-N(6)/adenine(1519)-N(6))-dimethyltransferase RsmA [Rickettsiaceae bacterium]